MSEAAGHVEIDADRERIAEGPFARLFVRAVVVDEGSQPAAEGRRLARAGAVSAVDVERGEIGAIVSETSGREVRVTLGADPVPPRVWSAVIGSTSGRELVQASLDGRARGVQLEHHMTVDWEEPLVPHHRSIRRRCACRHPDASGHACAHVAAVAYAVAHLLDRDVGVLLRFRGCDPDLGTSPAPEPAVVVATPFPDDAWIGGAVPAIGQARPLPLGAVVKRLGRSGIRVGGDDLAVALERAYAAFAVDD